MVFIASPKNKAVVIETIMKQFKMTDSASAEHVGLNYLIQAHNERHSSCSQREHLNRKQFPRPRHATSFTRGIVEQFVLLRCLAQSLL